MSARNEKITIIVNRDGMGEADAELSTLLIKNYLSLLISEEIAPSYICFYANGVKLNCTGSPILEELKILEKMGCKLLICKTCLVFNNLLDQVVVGTVGTMLDIFGAQINSTKVINL